MKRIGCREALFDDPGASARGNAANSVDPKAHNLVGQKG